MHLKCQVYIEEEGQEVEEKTHAQLPKLCSIPTFSHKAYACSETTLEKTEHNQEGHLGSILLPLPDPMKGKFPDNPRQAVSSGTFTSNDFFPELDETMTPMDFLSRSNSRVATRSSELAHA